MMTRRELLDRVEGRMRGRDARRIEASLCFLRAVLLHVGDDDVIDQEMLDRVADFLQLPIEDLERPPRPTIPPPSAAPPTRMQRVLFLGRADPHRIPMLEAVATSRYAEIADVRGASIAPAPIDPRVIKALRHAGYVTDTLSARSVTVDDLSWADLVVTVDGDPHEWERFIPRSIVHAHHPIPDPRTIEVPSPTDELDVIRGTLRAVESVVAAVKPARPSRFPPPPPRREGESPSSARSVAGPELSIPKIPPPPGLPKR